MLAGEFERKLRKLNRNLRIFCGDNDSRAAGLFTVVRNEYKEICGVDKNFIPEYTIKDNFGYIVKSGFRRIIKLLINQGYIDRKQAEREFSLSFEYRSPKFKYSSPSLREKLMRKGIPVSEESNAGS
jgi:hypothetical protein